MNQSMLQQREFSMKNALVLDHNPIECLIGKAMLERLGFSVAIANNGEQALALLTERTIDLVLCDISMPGIGGLDLLKITRSYAHPPLFIISTSFDDAQHAVESLRGGAYGYLIKPLCFEALRGAIAEAQARYQEDQNSIGQDSLTHLMNKSEFSRRLRQRLHTAPVDTACGAVLLIKLHGLTHFNHSYGRSEGDKVLKLAAATLSNQMASTDMLARIGGDIFALYINSIEHDHVQEKAISLSLGMQGIKIAVTGGDVFNLALVIGGACADAASEVDELFNRADFALHLARERSHNRIRIYGDADEIHRQELSHQLNTLSLVRTALLDDPSRIAMHYQPIIDLTGGKISHFEALLRLQDENGAPCDAGELIKACEVFGLIGLLDRAVVKICLADSQGLPENAGIAINLSGKSVGDPELLHLIETQIEMSSIDPSRIIFELTETATISNLGEVRQFIQRIKSLGCRFALDDFGVGFSSFSYLKELDLDYLKLDGSFIVNLPHNPNDQVFVRAMVEISRVCGLSVIAEWVEDEETAEMLREFGIALGQRWFIHRLTAGNADFWQPKAGRSTVSFTLHPHQSRGSFSPHQRHKKLPCSIKPTSKISARSRPCSAACCTMRYWRPIPALTTSNSSCASMVGSTWTGSSGRGSKSSIVTMLCAGVF